jgi:hypothetical protein
MRGAAAPLAAGADVTDTLVEQRIGVDAKIFLDRLGPGFRGSDMDDQHG